MTHDCCLWDAFLNQELFNIFRYFGIAVFWRVETLTMVSSIYGVNLGSSFNEHQSIDTNNSPFSWELVSFPELFRFLANFAWIQINRAWQSQVELLPHSRRHWMPFSVMHSFWKHCVSRKTRDFVKCFSAAFLTSLIFGTVPEYNLYAPTGWLSLERMASFMFCDFHS